MGQSHRPECDSHWIERGAVREPEQEKELWGWTAATWPPRNCSLVTPCTSPENSPTTANQQGLTHVLHTDTENFKINFKWSWSEAHLSSPGVFCLCVKEFISSSTCLGQGSQHITISCQATHRHKKIRDHKHINSVKLLLFIPFTVYSL